MNIGQFRALVHTFANWINLFFPKASYIPSVSLILQCGLGLFFLALNRVIYNIDTALSTHYIKCLYKEDTAD